MQKVWNQPLSPIVVSDVLLFSSIINLVVGPVIFCGIFREYCEALEMSLV